MKKYAVFYIAGGGGHIVSWLIQCALDHTSIDKALACWPSILTENLALWRKHESVPADVGLVCSGYMPYDCMDSNRAKRMISRTLDTTTKKPRSVYDGMHLRVRLYEGHGDFKEETDVLFDPRKQIFVDTPPEFIKMSLAKKNSTVLPLVMDEFINDQIRARGLPVFRFQTIWNKDGTYIEEIEKIFNRKLTQEQIEACDALVDRYKEITPNEMNEMFRKEMYGP